jgi:hypothetical protein
LIESDEAELRRLLWQLLGGTCRGENRARIIDGVRRRPKNLNQLATRPNLNYRAIQNHIEVLRKNSIVFPVGQHHGLVYFLNQWLDAHISLFDEICKKLNFGFEEEPKLKISLEFPVPTTPAPIYHNVVKPMLEMVGIVP